VLVLEVSGKLVGGVPKCGDFECFNFIWPFRYLTRLPASVWKVPFFPRNEQVGTTLPLTIGIISGF
jgi:hypothetical protein